MKLTKNIIMTQFKTGDKFIPRKPKDTNEYPGWEEEMNEYDGKVLTVSGIGYFDALEVKETRYVFDPDWCEKVEEHTVATNKMIDWNKLRNAFFKECTEDKGGVKVVNMAPHDLFEWFVEKIGKEPSL